LHIANAPDVPFCAAAGVTMDVVLARSSAPERVRSGTDSGAVDGTYSTGCRTLFCIRCSWDR